MMVNMKQKLILVLALLGMLVATPTSALAKASQEEEPKLYDARLEGYPQNTNVTLELGSSAAMWFLVMLLAAMCAGVMFMNAKRSHLD